jgi:sec-independent protein translocase protein TatA
MFDPSAPHIIILLVVVLVLFGSTRLPGAAEALGKSMRIFKSEAKKLSDDDKPADGARVTPASALQQPAAPQPLPGQTVPQDATQQQLADLQRQVEDLRRQSPGGDGTIVSGVPLSEAQRTQQPFRS